MGFQIEEYQKIQSEMGIEGFEECFQKGEWVDINQIIRDFYPKISEQSENKIVSILSEALDFTGILLDARKGSRVSLNSVKDKIYRDFMECFPEQADEKLLDATFYAHIKILNFFGFDFYSIEGYMFTKREA